MSIFKTLVKLILRKGMRTSYSQFGEDLIIRPFVPKGKGIYVDVGCYHPILYSNTYRLYRKGWSGIVVDPNIGVKKLFSVFRPRDRFVCAAVGIGGEKDYFVFSDGAYNTLDSELADAYKSRTHFIGTHKISLRPLSDICAGMDRIDLLNVDVEGLDLEVLETHDWVIKPRVIIVEARPDSPVAKFLAEKGYVLVGFTHLNSIFKLLAQ